MRKKGIIAVLLTVLCAIGLAACGTKFDDSQLIKDGYTAIVTFDCRGGKIGNFEQISYYYKPDSYIAEPGGAGLEKSEPVKAGFHVEGWYRDEAYTDRWDFKADKAQEGRITLYANWAHNLTYTVVYFEENESGVVEEKALVSYEANSAGKFGQSGVVSRDGYTLLGLYEDPEMKRPWDKDHVHGGAESGQYEEKVYSKWLEGRFTLVSSPDDFKNMVSSPRANYYLLNNIDFGAEGAADWLGYLVDYEGTILGNGYTISNIALPDYTNNKTQGRYGLFGSFAGKLVDVKFLNVTLTAKPEVEVPASAGLFAGAIKSGAQFDSVVLTGTFKYSNGKSTAPAFHALSPEIASGVSLAGIDYSNVNFISLD